MEPTIRTGDLVVQEKFTRKFKPGDVVTCTSPVDPDLILCKRVVALEGDRVLNFRHGIVREVSVPRGHVWLQGDNRYDSSDSRDYGPIPLSLVQGRVFARIYPPSRVGRLAENSFADIVNVPLPAEPEPVLEPVLETVLESLEAFMSPSSSGLLFEVPSSSSPSSSFSSSSSSSSFPGLLDAPSSSGLACERAVSSRAAEAPSSSSAPLPPLLHETRERHEGPSVA